MNTLELFCIRNGIRPFVRNCSVCTKKFKTFFKNKNLCSFACAQQHQRDRSKTYARQRRHPRSRPRPPCVVCGFSMTTDRHIENSKTYRLCPNHHALITRNIMSLKDVLAIKASSSI